MACVGSDLPCRTRFEIATAILQRCSVARKHGCWAASRWAGLAIGTWRRFFGWERSSRMESASRQSTHSNAAVASVSVVHRFAGGRWTAVPRLTGPRRNEGTSSNPYGVSDNEVTSASCATSGQCELVGFTTQASGPVTVAYAMSITGKPLEAPGAGGVLDRGEVRQRRAVRQCVVRRFRRDLRGPRPRPARSWSCRAHGVCHGGDRQGCVATCSSAVWPALAPGAA
jgi:hypothetical protein